MATPKENSSSSIQRRAINPSGQLGSLYDACRDQLINTSKTNCQERCFAPSEPMRCDLISGCTDESNDLLEWMGIQTELQLSLVLKLVNRTGIAEVLDYPRCIDECTRFLYYSRALREYRIEETPKLKDISVVWNRSKRATHIITSRHVGIDIIIVLQLPTEKNIASQIDSILQKICRRLSKDEKNLSQLPSEDARALRQLESIQVYSNIRELRNLFTVSEILEEIDAFRKKASRCAPLSYTLQTIKSLYPASAVKPVAYKPLFSNVENNTKKYMVIFRNAIEYLRLFFDGKEPKLSDKQSQHLFNQIHAQFLQTKNIYMNELQRFSMLVSDGRSGQVSASKIYQARCDTGQVALKESMNRLAHSLKGLNITKVPSTSLREKILECLSAAEACLNENNETSTVERKPSKPTSQNQKLESRDSSKPKDRLNSNIERQRSSKEYDNSSPQSPSAVSFPNSPFQKDDTPKSPSNATKYGTDQSKQTAASPEILPTSPISPPCSSSTDDIINILLLGETGVGKSTFINAFANYLTFNSLEVAQKSEPIVLMPVSFIMTTGDNFDEQTITFGEIDSSNNENFNDIGQSVTQHCKSYTFALHQYNGRKLRIIDTPGFGDTRGVEQNDQNIEHILQYISNLTHLNGICFLLKPNSSRLNMFFRSCLTQLFSFLAPAARKNVIFCFTNGRSTFFTPGDTAPLLKAMLADSSMKEIPFKKENTFCFDSESFRYLVALRNQITFTDEDEHEYQISWSTSVKESNRLLDYIHGQLVVYSLENGWQSIKHLQYEITYMIRPLLEAMRNLLRNIILDENKVSTEFTQLQATPLSQTDALHHSCSSNPIEIGKFWIATMVPDEIEDDSHPCTCNPRQSVRIDYALAYERLDDAQHLHQYTTQKTVDILCNASAEFAHFLMHVACSTRHDPFLDGLKTMLEEEIYICQTQKQPRFNKQLIEKLEHLQDDYKQKINKIKPNSESMGLSALSKFVKTTSECFLVREQLAAVKQTQQIIMDQYECQTQNI